MNDDAVLYDTECVWVEAMNGSHSFFVRENVYWCSFPFEWLGEVLFLNCFVCEVFVLSSFYSVDDDYRHNHLVVCCRTLQSHKKVR